MVNISIITWLVATVLMSTAALSNAVLVLTYLPVFVAFVLLAEGAIFFYISFANKHVEKLRQIVFSVFGVQIAAALALAVIPLHSDPQLVPWFMAAIFGAVFLTLGLDHPTLKMLRTGFVVAILAMTLVFFAGGRDAAKASAGEAFDKAGETASQVAEGSESENGNTSGVTVTEQASGPACPGEPAETQVLQAGRNVRLQAQRSCWTRWINTDETNWVSYIGVTDHPFRVQWSDGTTVTVGLDDYAEHEEGAGDMRFQAVSKPLPIQVMAEAR